MLFRQIIHEDLGCASYLVADREAGVAAVVDPQWDVESYRRLARLHGVRIGHVLETHNHADHVSGHGRLARTTGATIHIHELAGAEYAHEPFADGWVLELGDRPPNVAQIVDLNRGPLVEDFGTPAPLTPHEVEEAVDAGAVVIDGRTNEEFDEAHIAGALSTSAYDTGFATKVSRVAPGETEIIVVAASDGDERQAAELLAAVGLRVRGFLAGGMTAWRTEERPVRKIELIDPDELARRVDGPEPPLVLDVRNAAEYAGEHIPGSLHIPYGDLAERFDELPRDRPIAAICRGGKRSGLGASILQRAGFADVIHVGQGVGIWRQGGHPVQSGAETPSPAA
jgi:hydroxyacylglutathione hydrolase